LNEPVNPHSECSAMRARFCELDTRAEVSTARPDSASTHDPLDRIIERVPDADRPESDRRVRKTRSQLRDALVSLVLTRGWEAVSVKDVCERADLGRSTFYVHFVDKEDLLLSGFEDLHRSLSEPKDGSPQAFGFVEALVAHATDNVRLYRALLGKKSGQAVQRRFRETVGSVVDAELEPLGVAPDDRMLLRHFIVGGFVEMLLTWIDQPKRVSSDVLAARFRRFALGAIEAARARG
jgi:AcrR family transcriptional regulator